MAGVGMHSHAERGNESRLQGCGKFFLAGAPLLHPVSVQVGVSVNGPPRLRPPRHRVSQPVTDQGAWLFERSEFHAPRKR